MLREGLIVDVSIRRIKNEASVWASFEVGIDSEYSSKVAFTRKGVVGSEHRDFSCNVNATKLDDPAEDAEL